MNYYFSAKENAFYSAKDIDSYKNAGTLPDDIVLVEDDIFITYAAGNAPEGKYRGVDVKGLPCWLDIIEQPFSIAELIEVAKKEKERLLDSAGVAIAPLQDAIDLGIATDEESATLKAWKTYRVLLNRVDTSKAPDIEWPEPPEDVA